MALPTQKRSKSRKRKRQYQFRLKKINLSICPKCKRSVLPHQVCSFCGTYKKQQILKVKTKSEKRQSKT